MEEKTIKYGNVSFADLQVGSIVKVSDYYDRVAVGVVEEKRETTKFKSAVVRFGFSDNSTENVIIEEKVQSKGEPCYTLLEIVRSYI